MRSLALTCCEVALSFVDEAGTGVLAELPAWLPPECEVLPQAVAGAVAYRICGDDAGQYRLHCDGIDISTLADEVMLLSRLRQEVDNTVARRSRRWLFVHAAVVGWRGRAIVIPGRSYSGKTSLAAALVRRGAVYCSDEFALLDETGAVHAYRRAPGFREPQPPGQGLRLLRDDLPLRPLPVALVLSTTYQAGLNWRPTVLQGTRAVLPLIDNAVLAREAAESLLERVARMAPGLVTLQGPRGDAAEVAARTLDLVDAAVAGQAMTGTAGTAAAFAEDLAQIARQRLGAAVLPPARQLSSPPWLRVPDLLSDDEHRQLVEFTLANEAKFEPSGIINRDGRPGLDPGFRSSLSFRGGATPEIWALFEQRLHAILPAVRKALGVPHFRLCSIERQLTAHRDGGFFAPHADVGSPVTDGRRISCVYYFNVRPRRFSGGALKLYDWWDTPAGRRPAGTCTRLDPLDNSLLFFRSTDIHEVMPVQCHGPDFDSSRFTVVIWFRVDETPPGQPLPAEAASPEPPTAPATEPALAAARGA